MIVNRGNSQRGCVSNHGCSRAPLASRMGQLGNAVGKFVYSFRKASKGNDFVDVKPLPPTSRRGSTDRRKNGKR